MLLSVLLILFVKILSCIDFFKDSSNDLLFILVLVYILLTISLMSSNLEEILERVIGVIYDGGVTLLIDIFHIITYNSSYYSM